MTIAREREEWKSFEAAFVAGQAGMKSTDRNYILFKNNIVKTAIKAYFIVYLLMYYLGNKLGISWNESGYSY